MTKCYFTTNIAELIECDLEGEFDFNGFAINKCDKYPCERYKKMAEMFDGKPEKIGEQ